MTTGNSIYTRLSEKIGVTGYPRYVKILEAQLTPQEAELICDLADGMSQPDLMKKLQIDEKNLTSRIDDLLRKGCVQARGSAYAIPQSPRFFHRRGDTPQLQQLWHDFFHSGDYPEIHIHHIKARAQTRSGAQSHKIIPARQALLASTNLNRQNILWYEDMGQIFQKAKKRYQGGIQPDGSLIARDGCGCRRFWGDCDAPGGCTGWEWAEGTWNTDDTLHYEQAKRGLPRLNRREISVEEAVSACDAMEDWGLVHISPNTGQITSTCNCCECDCEILHGMKHYGNIYEMLAPSRFRAVIDQSKCTGCQTCIERCHFDAIEMRAVPGSKKMKSFIIDEHCMGCGLCIFKCPSQAMRFEVVRPPEYIPVVPMNVLFGGR